MKRSNGTPGGLWRNERGSVIITFAVSIVALFSFAVIAIDGAILMATKNQLQSAADAAALAGASGLKVDEGEAKDRAILYASYNYAVQDSLQPVIIFDEDVEIIDGNKVRVKTFRTVDHGDPLRTYFLRILDLAAGLDPSSPNTVDVSAVATAELVDNCAARCVKPWAIPDRWEDTNGNTYCDVYEEYDDSNGNCNWDLGENFDDIDNDGTWDAGEFYDPVLTGYLAPGDVGQDLVMHSSQTPGPVTAGQYYSICLPPYGQGVAPLTGADVYREFIAGCAPYIVSPGDSCLLQPGLMSGPTIQGIIDLINADPNATWDSATQTVQGSEWGQSPRIAMVPFYDPRFPPISGRATVTISKIGAFFLESVGPGSQINGRFIQVTAPGDPCDENTGQSFVLGLHLIE